MLPPVTSTCRLAHFAIVVLLSAVPALSPAQSGGPLAPGDRVALRLPGENTPPEFLEIDHRGYLTLPRAGAISVLTLEPAQLADSVRVLYTRLFTATDISVLLLRRITVFGEVKKPGVMYLDPTSTIRDAVATAEGATEFADISHVNLIRGDVRHRLKNWATASAATQPLRSGDAIEVDRESWIRRNVSSLLGALGILASIAVALSR
jgi:protein involved in polysaccharide export with SLBB domain